MPKRFSNLWTPISDNKNVKISARQVLDRRRQKGRWGQMEQYIEDNFEQVCSDIERSLKERTYDFGKLFHRSIKERKKIRVLDYLDTYHAIYLQCVMNVCQPLFISKYIPTTYSSIKGRGLTQMSQHIWRTIRRHPEKGFILIDMSKCYQNVNHSAMHDMLTRTFKDKYLIEFFDRLMALLPEGLAIGFSTNHYLVNLLFNNLDHRLDKMPHVHIYRYMDDIFIIANPEDLPMIYKIVQEEADKIKQKIKPNARFAPISYGAPLCGYIYYNDHMRLKKDIVKSMYAKDKHLRKIHASDEEYKQQMASYWGWCKYAHATALFKAVLKDKTYLFEKQLNQMKHFSDIAQGRDKPELYERYEGTYWHKADEEKYIIQARIDNELGYFFTQAIGITDKLERYAEELPFTGTIKELKNKLGKNFMTIV